MEPTKLPEVVEAVTGIIKAVPVYDDLAQPAVRQLGLALETVAKTVRVAIAPIAGLVWGYEKIGEYLDARLTEKLRYVPPERISTPPAHVAGPAIEALRFTGESAELREMYATLLATAMDGSTVEQAHPAFVDIIKSMTPDEAKIMRTLSDGRHRPQLTLIARQLDDAGELVHSRHQTLLDIEASVSRPALFPSYIDNLVRLGLLDVPEGKVLMRPDAYSALEADENIQLSCKQIEASGKHKAVMVRSLIRLTDLGRQFVHACVLDNHKPEEPSATA